jgi:hypothetical protein
VTNRVAVAFGKQRRGLCPRRQPSRVANALWVLGAMCVCACQDHAPSKPPAAAALSALNGSAGPPVVLPPTEVIPWMGGPLPPGLGFVGELAACSDGIHALVMLAFSDGNGNYQARLFRFRPDGWPAESAGTRFVGSLESMTCTWNGQHFLVAGAVLETRMGLMDATGPLDDVDAGYLSPHDGGGRWPQALASAGGVSYLDYYEEGGAWKGTRISRGGVLLDDPPTLLPRGVVSADTSQILFAATSGTYSGRLINPDGGSGASFAMNSMPAPQGHASISFDGQAFWITWFQWAGPLTPSFINASRVTSDGTLLIPGVTLSSIGFDPMRLTSSTRGERFVVGWLSDGPYGSVASIAEVERDGGLVSPPIQLSDFSHMLPPAFATSDHRTFVLGADGAHVNRTVLDETGALTDPGHSVTGGFPPQNEPAAAWGREPVIAWADFRTGDLDVYVAKIVNGVASNPGGTPVATGFGDQTRPAIAVGDGGFLVVWESSADTRPEIWGARLDIDGQPIDDGGFRISPPGSFGLDPALAFDGTNYVVAWVANRGGQSDIVAARVTLEGVVLDQPIDVSAAPANQYAPTVAFDGVNTLVGWQDHQDGGTADVLAVRLSPGGTVVDVPPIPVAVQLDDQADPAGAGSPGGGLIVWTDSRDGARARIRGRRWFNDGGYGEDFDISGGPGRVAKPAAAFDGDSYVVTWIDFDRGNVAGRYGVIIARVGLEGELPDDAGVQVTKYAQDYRPNATLGCNNAGSCLVGWIFPDGEQSLETSVVLMPPFRNGTPCTSRFDCISGWCVDGVCCDTACETSDAGDFTCAACSRAKGSAADGTCSAVPADTVCRPAVDSCDLPEVCDGALLTCPAFDTWAPSGTLCRRSWDDQCDVAELCTGTSPSCPPDVRLNEGQPCTPASPCQTNATCTRGFCTGPYRECSGPCFEAYCDEGSGDCVTTIVFDGQSCVEPASCQLGICSQSTCVLGAENLCAPPPQCYAEACRGNGQCSFTPLAEGVACDDNDVCTVSDLCSGHVCAGTPLGCGDAGPCGVARCDAVQGCMVASVADGTACGNGSCLAGSCSHDDGGREGDAGLARDGGHDAGSGNDAGLDDDAGNDDAGSAIDAGAAADAGAPDQRIPFGGTSSGPSVTERGCGCDASGWPIAAFALIAAVKRGRRR